MLKGTEGRKLKSKAIPSSTWSSVLLGVSGQKLTRAPNWKTRGPPEPKT